MPITWSGRSTRRGTRGPDIIHVAIVQPTQSGTAESLLERAVRTCLDEGILVVSPAGNDRGECWTMPSAIPGVLAVGAMNDEGQPFQFSNYGGILQSQGVLAPGENILGADSTNGGTRKQKGTSCAAPIVTGVAALLMSLQLRQGRQAVGRGGPPGHPRHRHPLRPPRGRRARALPSREAEHPRRHGGDPRVGPRPPRRDGPVRDGVRDPIRRGPVG